MDAHLRALLLRAEQLGIGAEFLEVGAEQGVRAEQLGAGTKRLEVGRNPPWIEAKPTGAHRWVRFRYDGRIQIVRDGTLFESLSAVADAVCSNKHQCKQFLSGFGIPVPDGLLVSVTQLDGQKVKSLLQRVGAVVAKPACGTDGVGVALAITDLAQVKAYLRDSLEPQIILEEQVSGHDLRIQAIGGTMVCACIRHPARVVGDGHATVTELIEERNQDLAALNPANRIEVDEEAHAILAEAGSSLDMIPALGHAVQLKRVANISQGGTAVDVTGQLHPRYSEWVEEIGRSLSMSVFSLDAMTADPSTDPLNKAMVLEINSRPSWLHHTFSEGRTHDIAGMLLKDLFPEVETSTAHPPLQAG